MCVTVPLFFLIINCIVYWTISPTSFFYRSPFLKQGYAHLVTIFRSTYSSCRWFDYFGCQAWWDGIYDEKVALEKSIFRWKKWTWMSYVEWCLLISRLTFTRYSVGVNLEWYTHARLAYINTYWPMSVCIFDT